MEKLIKKFKQWYYIRFTKCGFCNHNLFRYGACHGAVDININIGGTNKKTVYLCNLCYHLFKK